MTDVETYQEELETLVTAFRYELCECGGDAHEHLFGTDPLGHAHAYCLREADQ